MKTETKESVKRVTLNMHDFQLKLIATRSNRNIHEVPRKAERSGEQAMEKQRTDFDRMLVVI